MTMPLVLIDGSSYFYRAFHALPPLTNSRGEPTGAIYGVASMVKRLINDHPAHHVAVIFDAPGKTFRDTLYPAYKAHRPSTPPELKQQFAPLCALLTAMGLPLVIIEGVEADDVIGTLAHAATAASIPVIISTSDKDMAQLVNDHVTLINTMSNQRLNCQGVMDKFGVKPTQIIDYLALLGDTSDNIPGVPQCGPKTAAKWLAQYGTLEKIMLHASDISGKIGEKLRDSLNFLPLAKQLVTIKLDVDLPVTPKTLTLKPADATTLLALTRELEFKTWTAELIKQAPVVGASPDPQRAYTLITTPQALHTWIDQVQTASLLCLSTLNGSADASDTAEWVGIAMAIENSPAVYIPVAHRDGSEQLSKDQVLQALKPVLEDKTCLKLGYNLKYVYNVFKNEGITLQGVAFDTMLESYVLNSSGTRHTLEPLSLKYLGYSITPLEALIGKAAKQRRFNAVPVREAGAYATQAVNVTLQLHQKLYPLLQDGLQSVLNTIEMPLVTILADMERHGVLVDTHTLAKQGVRLQERIDALQQEAFTLAGSVFNLDSPKQLQTILFQTLQLPALKKTPTGQISTAESVLQDLACDYRFPAVILQYRSLSKLMSTYIEALPKRVNPKTGRIHTSYNQAVAATGRLSSSDPNLQNIPVRTAEGRLIRKAFIAPKDSLLIAADYSQIELRIMAHLSQDPALLRAFAQDLDIHTATAAEMFQIPLDAVTSEQRRRAKSINFGLIYGMSAFGLAKQLGIARDEAQRYIDCYFLRYPGVLEYMENTRSSAHQNGYVETLYGRRLYLPEINTQNQMRRKAAERMAINAPMQGTAADIIKKAMIRLADWQASEPQARLIMQVHDELVFEVHHEAVVRCTEVICHAMEQVVTLSVPLRVSIGVGANWDEAAAH